MYQFKLDENFSHAFASGFMETGSILQNSAVPGTCSVVTVFWEKMGWEKRKNATTGKMMFFIMNLDLRVKVWLGVQQPRQGGLFLD